MDLFDSMDYAIDYKVEDKEKTFLVDKEELFIALVDIRKQNRYS